MNLRQYLRRHRRAAPASVHFTQAMDGNNHLRSCVYVTCLQSEQRVGPIWGHADESVRCALAKLTQECECPASFHSGQEFSGRRIAVS